MKKYSVKVNDMYLHGFEPNETYCKNARCIQSNLHSDSEYNAILSKDKKLFDSATLKGYITSLIETIRWNGLVTDKIEIEVEDLK